jgi:hypothetical protein
VYPLHPVIFGLYPILALLAFNVAELNTSLGYRALLVSLGAAILLVIALRFVYRDWKRAALVSTILLILFYSYGHAYIALKGINWGGVYLFRHRTLIPLWGVIGFVLIWWASRKLFNLPTVTSVFNTAGLFLLILPVYQLISYPIQSRMATDNMEEGVLSLKIGDTPPDIYYIILDGYGRSDVLQNEYGFDNSEFLNSLRTLGFYVADCSQSNYAQTQISVSSTLNFDYLDALGDFAPGTDDRGELEILIKQNVVRRSLEAAGYKTVAFATGFNWTQLGNANYYLAPQSRAGNLNEFENLLLETTFARIVQDYALLGEQDSGSSLYRERTLFALEKLDELSYIKEPKFVFVHIIAPHPPYVFGPTGGPVASGDVGDTRSDKEPALYRDQVAYITSRIQEIVPKIIASSARPPIIVIQGDHGPTVASNPQSRMKNLSVYYLPGVDAKLYPTITPVNSFRVIFNEYFGQSLPLLKDVSHYSVYTDPFSFKIIPNSCESN